MKCKYRLVKDTNKLYNPPLVTYVIEKQISILFWNWWSRDYIHDIEYAYTCYQSNDLKHIKHILYTLNNDLNIEWTIHEIISI